MEIKRVEGGRFGTYHNVPTMKGPELCLMTSDEGGVDVIEGGIVIPARHLNAFITELIHMAWGLGVTAPPESPYKNALAETHFPDMGLDAWTK